MKKLASLVEKHFCKDACQISSGCLWALGCAVLLIFACGQTPSSPGGGIQVREEGVAARGLENGRGSRREGAAPWENRWARDSQGLPCRQGVRTPAGCGPWGWGGPGSPFQPNMVKCCGSYSFQWGSSLRVFPGELRGGQPPAPRYSSSCCPESPRVSSRA